jgi:hypothetical protein
MLMNSSHGIARAKTDPVYRRDPSTDQLVSRCGLMNRSAMVHKLPAVAGDSATAAT